MGSAPPSSPATHPQARHHLGTPKAPIPFPGARKRDTGHEKKRRPRAIARPRVSKLSWTNELESKLESKLSLLADPKSKSSRGSNEASLKEAGSIVADEDGGGHGCGVCQKPQRAQPKRGKTHQIADARHAKAGIPQPVPTELNMVDLEHVDHGHGSRVPGMNQAPRPCVLLSLFLEKGNYQNEVSCLFLLRPRIHQTFSLVHRKQPNALLMRY